MALVSFAAPTKSRNGQHQGNTDSQCASTIKQPVWCAQIRQFILYQLSAYEVCKVQAPSSLVSCSCGHCYGAGIAGNGEQQFPANGIIVHM